MTPEDKKLWDALKGTIKPLKKKKKVPKKSPSSLPAEASSSHGKSNDILISSPSPKKTVVHTVVDKTLVKRLRKGNIHIEGRIDLHGMTQKQAVLALNRFISQAKAQHKKLVIIITGKGAPVSFSNASTDDSPRGVLRQMLPQWLQEGEVAGVRSLSPALPEHGGTGAFYATLYL